MKKTLITLIAVSLLIPAISFAQNANQTSDIAPDSGSPCVDLLSNVGKGAYGSDVFELQGYLNDSGYLSVDPTGYYGNMTVAAVNGLQTANGLSPTGYVGPLTRGIIKNATCPVTIGSPAPNDSSTSTPSITDYSQYTCEQLRGMNLDLYHSNNDLFNQVSLREQLANDRIQLDSYEKNSTLIGAQTWINNYTRQINMANSQISSSSAADYLASCSI